MITIQFNAEIYGNPQQFLSKLSAPSKDKICIIAYNQHEASLVFSELINLFETCGIVHKTKYIDRRIESVYGNIWIMTPEYSIERTIGVHWVRIFVTKFGYESIRLGMIPHLNARTKPCQKQSDAPTEDLPSAT